MLGRLFENKGSIVSVVNKQLIMCGIPSPSYASDPCLPTSLHGSEQNSKLDVIVWQFLTDMKQSQRKHNTLPKLASNQCGEILLF